MFDLLGFVTMADKTIVHKLSISAVTVVTFKKGPPLECGVPPDPIVEGVYISMSLLVKTTFLPLIWVKDERCQRFDAGKRD